MARPRPSTLSRRSRPLCRESWRALPPNFRVTPLFDQSLFVRASIYGVLREAIIAAVLTGLMILLFLGSWRSTLIVCTSIPLAILTSQIILSCAGAQHQRHDVGRHGAGRRNPGRRRHGGAGERSPQHGHEEAADARDSRRRLADCSAHAGFHACRSASCSFPWCC